MFCSLQESCAIETQKCPSKVVLVLLLPAAWGEPERLKGATSLQPPRVGFPQLSLGTSSSACIAPQTHSCGASDHTLLLGHMSVSSINL